MCPLTPTKKIHDSNRWRGKDIRAKISILFLLLFAVFSACPGISAEAPREITLTYSGTSSEDQVLTVELADSWLLEPDDVYHHDLMQASFGLATSAFRNKNRPINDKDHDILDFFKNAGFTDPRTDDYHTHTGLNTIASAIAKRQVGDATIIAVAISGNNYEDEWLSNLTVDDDYRASGFNSAAGRVTARLDRYIKEYHLEGELRLWVAGYSRAAAVTNLFAADAIDSGKFQAVYAYCFAPPRTTREEQPERYRSIYNIIMPFDVVPMIPFPEWGFRRYGTDLFFPSIETSSKWTHYYYSANNIALEVSGSDLVFNPEISLQLRTILDYIAFFINSATSYTNSIQSPLLEFWKTKDLKTLVDAVRDRNSFGSIISRLHSLDSYTRFYLSEFWDFLDYLSQVVYTTFIGQKFHSEDAYWDSGLSMQENLAYNHYDKTYRSWIYCTDDTDGFFTTDPSYAHYTVVGDVDIELFDEKGDFIERIDREGYVYFSREDIITENFSGELSSMLLYANRQGNQTLIILPLDQTFTAAIHSHADQDIRISYVKYSAENLRADVRYVYYDHYEKGESFPEEIDPIRESQYTAGDLQEMGVRVVEPWSRDIVYSPTGVMRLENNGIPHPTPRFFFITAGLILALIIIILILIGIKLGGAVRRRVKRAKKN